MMAPANWGSLLFYPLNNRSLAIKSTLYAYVIFSFISHFFTHPSSIYDRAHTHIHTCTMQASASQRHVDSVLSSMPRGRLESLSRWSSFKKSSRRGGAGVGMTSHSVVDGGSGEIPRAGGPESAGFALSAVHLSRETFWPSLAGWGTCKGWGNLFIAFVELQRGMTSWHKDSIRLQWGFTTWCRESKHLWSCIDGSLLAVMVLTENNNDPGSAWYYTSTFEAFVRTSPSEVIKHARI